MSLTSTQLSDIRQDLALPADPAVFTDTELQRFWTRVQADYTTDSEHDQLARVRLYALRALRADAAKLHDYRIASSMEYMSQVFKHLMVITEDWEKELGRGSQVRIVGMELVPPRTREKPGT